MLTIIILTGVALIALIIGFFEIKIPFINKTSNTSSKKKNVKEPAESLEAFYRSIRAEHWLYNIQHRSTSDIA